MYVFTNSRKLGIRLEWPPKATPNFVKIDQSIQTLRGGHTAW